MIGRVPEAFSYSGMADFRFLDLVNLDRRRDDALGVHLYLSLYVYTADLVNLDRRCDESLGVL